MAGLFFPGCSTHRPPTPVPTPTPTPAGMPPLTVQGDQFVPAILGSVTTHHGWPLIDAPGIDAIAGSGLNYTAIRMSCEIDDRPGYDMFVRVGDKVDLSQFNPAYDALLIQTLGHAHDRGLYVNVGLWDGWCAVHLRELRSPFKAANNVNGVDIGSCSDYQRAVDPTIRRVVEHIEGVVGRFSNVIVELGNEANRCQPTDEFIAGVRDIWRAAEAANHHGRHLWSPGTWEKGAAGGPFDFLSQHGLPVSPRAYPQEINEFSPQTKAQYLANLAISKASGVPYMYWHDDNPYGGAWDDPAWEAEWLETMKAMKATSPTTGCADIPNETAVAVVPRPSADPAITDAINGAMRRLKPACEVNSSCAIDVPLHAWLLAVADEVRKGPEGLCAGVQTDSEGLVDQICVGSTQQCQGHHVYTCKPGCTTGVVGWAPGSYTNRNGDTWRRP
jgi:hypothetical protein